MTKPLEIHVLVIATERSTHNLHFATRPVARAKLTTLMQARQDWHGGPTENNRYVMVEDDFETIVSLDLQDKMHFQLADAQQELNCRANMQILQTRSQAKLQVALQTDPVLDMVRKSATGIANQNMGGAN